MFYSYVFNGSVLNADDTIYNNIYYSYGFKKNAINYMEQKFENNINIVLRSMDKNQWDFFLDCLFRILPSDLSILNKKVFNIYMLDSITSYRGWRHSRGLPVRGQRTWSNSKSVNKSNNTLRNFKLNISRKYYGNIPFGDIRVATLAEKINDVWKEQWEHEWTSAKNSRLKYKGNRNLIKIDIYSMANNQVMHPFKLKNLSKKQKQSFKKNYFSLGFDNGFTKPLLMNLHNIEYNDANNQHPGFAGSTILTKERPFKKKLASKKNDNKKPPVKKKKKSVWD